MIARVSAPEPDGPAWLAGVENPYLQGVHAPILAETTALDLEVEGEIPPDLDGAYVRNGPNPVNGDPGHWFSGDGMIHGVHLEGGEAKSYRNRWVRTRQGDGHPRRDHDGGGAGDSPTTRRAARDDASPPRRDPRPW